MTPIALVESNEIIRRTLSQWINASPDCRCVTACINAEQAYLEFPTHRPSIALIDLHLRGESGITCMARLKERMPEVHVIIITKEKNQDLVFQALKCGASGYLLLEHTSDKEILWAIAEVQSGGAPMTGVIARRVIEVFHQPAAIATDLAGLSPREVEVLGGLSSGMSNKQIAARLDITYGTACVHLRRIYEKLGVRSRTEAVLKYFEAQSDSMGMIDGGRQRDAKKPIARLEFLHAENLRLAAELERNVREVIQLSAVEHAMFKKVREVEGRDKSAGQSSAASPTQNGHGAFKNAFPLLPAEQVPAGVHPHLPMAAATPPLTDRP